MEAMEKLYWTKALIATVIGILFSIIQSAAPLSGLVMLFLGISVYILLSDLLGRLYNIEQAKALKIGIGAYIFTWLIVWIIVYTLIQGTF
jgi:hypothetical protein